MNPEPELRNAEQARQGQTTGHMRWVLLISTAAAIIIVGIIAFTVKW